MGYPHLAACLWALCCLLSLLHAAAGAASALQCDTQSCSASSCCLGLPTTSSRQQWGGHWVCGCPHSMVRTIQNSSVVVCQEACNVTTLGMIRELCKEKKSSPLCSQLLDTTKDLKETCDNTTKEGLQAVLSKLQNVVRKEQCKQHGAIAATLLMESTEAIVLQARHGGILELNTTTMQAKTEVVNNTCITSGWELELNVDKEKLNINCNMLPTNTNAVAFIVYKGLEGLLGNITEPSLGKLNSHVVGSTVGKANITFSATFNITLQHTETLQEGEKLLCVSWKLNGSKGQWTPEGCRHIGVDNSSSICACNHFSTFAMLMNVNKMQNSYALDVVTYVGLSVSLLCLFLTIVTFILCRSLWSVSISLHLQLSICLFIADFLLLVAECLTTKELVCKIIAGFLHYFFLASFAWMFLEGLHLFLTVRNLRVLNYINANRFKRRYIYPVGYGLPAIVVATSAAIHPKGYSTKQHCWLNTEGGFIWSFVGPVCVIILINLMFFLITLWTLQKRLSSLNADVTAIKNTRLMTFKALAHVCILGCTWGVGLLQAPERKAVDFIFTIINSLQGAFIFLVHCVLNRQVMEHYRRWFRVLGRSPKPQETATTEMRITYVTEGERSQSHSAEGCAWAK